jgi:uncharacterized radical SAM protein YgiQ
MWLLALRLGTVPDCGYFRLDLWAYGTDGKTTGQDAATSHASVPMTRRPCPFPTLAQAPRRPNVPPLPTTRSEMVEQGYEDLDILLVTGDAYVDHPSFGASLVGRYLQSLGYRVGLVAQPRWDTTDEVAALGRPRLFVGVTAGNLDSMLSRLTAQGMVRSTDAYSPNGEPNQRPNRASIVYAQLCRRAFPGLPVIIGGIEASMRRIAHYDYWSDSVRRSVLLDSKSNLLVFGMAERALAELALRLAQGDLITETCNIRGTAHVLTRPCDWQPLVEKAKAQRHPSLVVLPSYEEVVGDKTAFAEMTRLLELEMNPYNGRPILQPHGNEAVLLNPPALPLATQELDDLAALPFSRLPHPRYTGQRLLAFESIRDSVVTNRGCFGGCHFCSITAHAGRIVQSRSPRSVIAEVRQLAQAPGFSGTIRDLGGPTANMYGLSCSRPDLQQRCRRRSCIHPSICHRLHTDHTPLLHLLEEVRGVPGVKHVFIASGIRHDLALESPAFIDQLAAKHVGGQLSVAPEHVTPRTLEHMGKPPIEKYQRFSTLFAQACERHQKDQYLVPYFLVGHPGSNLHDAIELALYLKRHGIRPRQVQEFIPTPMTVATAMYYTGLHPMTRQPVEVVRGGHQKKLLKSLALYWEETHWPQVREALVLAHRTELIGHGPQCLVPEDSPTATRRTAPGSLPRSGSQKARRDPRGKR